MDSAIVAGLAGVVGATSSAFISGYLHRRATAQQAHLRRQENDLDAWRVLLDDAIESLERYLDVLRGAEARYSFSPAPAITKESHDQIFDPVIEAKNDARRLERRIALRLGRESPVLLAYRRSLTLCDEAATLLGTTVGLPGTANGSSDERLRFSVRQDRADQQRKASFDQFLDASSAFVGDGGGSDMSVSRWTTRWNQTTSRATIAG